MGSAPYLLLDSPVEKRHMHWSSDTDTHKIFPYNNRSWASLMFQGLYSDKWETPQTLASIILRNPGRLLRCWDGKNQHPCNLSIKQSASEHFLSLHQDYFLFWYPLSSFPMFLSFSQSRSIINVIVSHSHSVVPGGLAVRSYMTRDTPGTDWMADTISWMSCRTSKNINNQN